MQDMKEFREDLEQIDSELRAVLQSMSDGSDWIPLSEMWVEDLYIPHVIPKKSGGYRQILAPKPRLMPHFRALQRRLTKHLDIDPVSMAVKNKGILCNARAHRSANYILKVDIKSFYDNCTQAKITRGLEYYNRDTTKEAAARLIEKYSWMFFYHPLKTIGGEMLDRGEENDHLYRATTPWLPTGNPCSPLLSNFALAELDYRMEVAMGAKGGNYTRYLDDLTISFKQKPREGIIEEVTELIEEFTFEVNWEKSKWINILQDQWSVTGIDLRNFELKAPRSFCQKLRILLDHHAKSVVPAMLSRCVLAPRPHPSLFDLLGEHTLGHMEFVRQINKEQFRKFANYYLDRLTKHLMYAVDAEPWVTHLYGPATRAAMLAQVDLYRTQVQGLIDR